MCRRPQRDVFRGRSAMCLEGPTPTPTTRRWEQMCDEVWCVTAPHALTLERLRARNGLEEEEAERRIASQVGTQLLHSPLILHPLLAQPVLLYPPNPARWAPTRARRDATSCSHRHGARRWCTSRRAARTRAPRRGQSSSCPHRRPRRPRPPRACRLWRAGAQRARARAWRRRCSASGGAGCVTCTATQCAAHHTSNAPRRGLPTRSRRGLLTRCSHEASPPFSAAPYRAQVRHYHTLTHLGEIFAKLDDRHASLEQPRRLAFATFFHDSIYEPTAKENELRSAQARGTAHDTWHMAHGTWYMVRGHTWTWNMEHGHGHVHGHGHGTWTWTCRCACPC